MKKSILFLSLLFVLSLTPSAARADYQSCREQKCGQGVSCKECNNAVNICCRNIYDNDGNLANYLNCTMANALGYAACTSEIEQSNAVAPGETVAEKFFAAVDPAYAKKLLDRDTALAVARQLINLAADLNSQLDEQPEQLN